MYKVSKNTASFEMPGRGKTALKITWHAGQKMVVMQDGTVIGEKAAPVSAAEGPLPSRFKNSLGMEFVLVPKGTAWLGGGAGISGDRQETIATDFYLGKFVVTQGQWKAVMGQDKNTSWFSRNGGGMDDVKYVSDADLDQFPLEGMRRNDITKFFARLNTLDYGNGWCYRLPTAVEWEYACRGGAISREESAFDFYFDKPTNDLSSEQANFNGNRPAGNAAKGKFLQRTCKVGSYPPNRLGLYDMHGNVCQHCGDVTGAPGPGFRGGCYLDIGSVCRAANPRLVASNIHGYLGLRVARVPVGK